jgi:hypothetical protein
LIVPGILPTKYHGIGIVQVESLSQESCQRFRLCGISSCDKKNIVTMSLVESDEFSCDLLGNAEPVETVVQLHLKLRVGQIFSASRRICLLAIVVGRARKQNGVVDIEAHIHRWLILQAQCDVFERHPPDVVLLCCGRTTETCEKKNDYG